MKLNDATFRMIHITQPFCLLFLVLGDYARFGGKVSRLDGEGKWKCRQSWKNIMMTDR